MGDSPKWVKSKKRRKRKRERERERLNNGDNNGQAMHGGRKPPGPTKIRAQSEGKITRIKEVLGHPLARANI